MKGKVIKRRREVASLYESKLSHLDEIKLPPAPSEDGAHFDIYSGMSETTKL